jgi:hypothetical protein
MDEKDLESPKIGVSPHQSSVISAELEPAALNESPKKLLPQDLCLEPEEMKMAEKS